MRATVKQIELSARAHYQVLELASEDNIQSQLIAEALHYRLRQLT